MKTLILLLLTVVSLPAHAIVDVRGFLGFSLIHASDFNTYLKQNSIQEIYGLPKYGAAAYLRPFTFNLGLGVEYDTQGIKVASAAGTNSAEAELQVSRLSAKAYYHIVETFFFTGPAVGVGLTHSPVLKLKIPSTNVDFNEGKGSSYSLGWETGFKAGPFIFGAEAGYQSYMIKSLRGTSGEAGFDIDLSGGYAFGFVGLMF